MTSLILHENVTLSNMLLTHTNIHIYLYRHILLVVKGIDPPQNDNYIVVIILNYVERLVYDLLT